VVDCSFPNIFPGDWLWVIEVALVGKVQILPSHHVYREVGNSLSSSNGGYHASLRHYNFPKWYPYLLWIAKAFDLSRYLLWQSIPARKYSPVVRILLSSLVAVTLLGRGAFIRVRAAVNRVPGARYLYQRYLKDRIGYAAGRLGEGQVTKEF